MSYAVMTLLGLIAAHAFVKRTGDAAHAVLVPPAFAVLGGTFMHYTQIMIAIPAALLLYEQSSERTRPVFGASLLLLAFPWAWSLGQPVLIVVYAAVSFGIAASVLRWSSTAALRVALTSALLTGVILIVGYRFGPGLSTHVHGITSHGGLAQSSWEAFVRSQRASTGIAWWVAKAPTWIGLVILALGCAYVLTKKDLVPPVTVEQVPVAP
jgi:hypothetical protein